MEIAIEGTISFATIEHLNDTLDLLSSRYDADRPPGDRVLNSPSGQDRSCLQIRQEHWLFSGELRLGRIDALSRRITLRLSINPTRFAEHLGRRLSPRSLAELENVDPRDLLRNRPEIAAAIASGTLDDSNNMLSGSAWSTVLAQEWPAFVSFHAHCVCRLVEQDFNDSSRRQNAVDPPIMRFFFPSAESPSFGYVEQHVEFLVDDVHHVFRAFERGISEAGGDSQVTELQTASGRTGSARWIETWLCEGVKLKVYAKALNRLRVEIEYHARSSGRRRKSIGSLVRNALWRGQHSFTDKVAALRADAAERIARLTRLVSALPDISTGPTPAEAMRDLMLELRRSRLSVDSIQAFLAVLFDQGYVGGANGMPIRKVAEAMVRKNLFEVVSITQRSAHRQFRPIPALRQAIEAIRELDTVQASPDADAYS